MNPGALRGNHPPSPPVPFLPFRTGGTFWYLDYQGAATTLVLVQSTMYARPFYLPYAANFIGMGVISTGVASSSARFGIYTDGGAIPDQLVVDGGSVATTASQWNSVTLNQYLTPGWYWHAIAVQGAAGSAFCNTSASVTGALLGTTAPGVASIIGGYSQTGVTAALPAMWGSTLTETARIPVMGLLVK